MSARLKLFIENNWHCKYVLPVSQNLKTASPKIEGRTCKPILSYTKTSFAGVSIATDRDFPKPYQISQVQFKLMRRSPWVL